MAHYDAYIEVDEGNRTIVHVLAIPGCFAIGNSQEAALTDVAQILQSQFPEETITVSVAERADKPRPLFTPEREPARAELVERYLQIAAQNRLELQNLIRPLAPAMRRWRAFTHQMTINEVLHHIASSEIWYIMRICGIIDQPTELSLAKFMQTTRMEVETRLSELTAEQLTAVVYPPVPPPKPL